MLTILVVVATINAVNFIDGLDGLAAGIVCIAAISFFIYYYSLTKGRSGCRPRRCPRWPRSCWPARAWGSCRTTSIPRRIFMGDTGSMLLGLLLAYVPIWAINSLDFTSLANKANRYAEILPLLLPAAVLVIPYIDMLRAVIRRTRAGMSPFAADRKHLHHTMLDIGHSHRSSVLILYAWAALFAGTVVGLSIVTVQLVVLVWITLAAVLVLVLLSMPRLRWWERGRAEPARPAGRSHSGRTGLRGGGGSGRQRMAGRRRDGRPWPMVTRATPSRRRIRPIGSPIRARGHERRSGRRQRATGRPDIRQRRSLSFRRSAPSHRLAFVTFGDLVRPRSESL